MSVLIRFFFRSQWAAMALATSILILGVLAFQKISIDAVPDITGVQVMINTKTGPYTPHQVEQLVTFPLENELNGIPGVKEVRSLSKLGLSQVIVVFNDSVDAYWARNQINERLQLVALPGGLRPEMAPLFTGLGEVVFYTVHLKPSSPILQKNEKEQLSYLRTVQEYQIRPNLRRVSGVADVDTNGGYQRQLHINFSPKKLQAWGLSLSEAKKLVMGLGESAGGGYIEENGTQQILSLVSELTDIEQVKQFPMKVGFGGKAIQIKDIADVRFESGLRVGAATQGGSETVLGTVLMRAGANSQEVARDTVAAIQDLILPEDVEVKIHYSRDFLVNQTIQTVSKNLLEGALLVVFILFLMLANLRAALLVTAIIPLSMMGAFIGMHLLGLSANLMSLGALDFGLIVDGSVVLVEAILYRLEKKKNISQENYLDLILGLSRPVFFGVLIIILVYVPVLFLGGVEGKMFRPMAITVLLALSFSLLFALAIVPKLSYWLLEGRQIQGAFWVHALEKKYETALAWVLHHRKVFIAGLGVFSAGVLAVFLLALGSDFIPQLDEKDLVLGLVRSTKQSLSQSIEDQKKAEKIILSHPEVQAVFSRMGTPDSGTDPMSVNFADTFVILKKSSWPVDPKLGRPLTKTELYDKMSEEINSQTTTEVSPTQPIEMRFNEILEGSRADVSLRIYGPDLEVLEDLANKAEKALQGMEGLSEIQFDPLTALTKSSMIEFKPDLNSLAKYGVSYGEIRDLFTLALSGETVGRFKEQQRNVPIVFHLDENLKIDSESLLQIPVDIRGQGMVPFKVLGQLDQKERVTTIARSWGQRYSALSLFVRGKDIQSFVNSAQERVLKQVEIPKGYRLHWGGQFQNLIEAKKRLMVLVPLTLLVILGLLALQFGHWLPAVLVFLAVPFSSLGGVLSLWLRGMPMTVPASIGFIALAGIAILNGLVLVESIRELHRVTPNDLERAVIQGSVSRLRPVLMTALVAGLGFIPMAVGNGTGSEVQRPLATVVIGGLVSASLLTLFILPLLTRWAFSKKRSAQSE